MPSPLSGFTQAAASPISAQLRAGDVGDRAAHRQQRRRRHPQVAAELELLAALVGVELHQRLDRDVRGSLRGRERADADVHLAGPQREDPAVAGEDLATLAAELEVRADPRVVGHPGRDVGAAGDAVHRVAVPLPAEHLAQRRADAVGHDQRAGRRSRTARPPARTRRRRPGRPHGVRRPRGRRRGRSRPP